MEAPGKYSNGLIQARFVNTMLWIGLRQAWHKAYGSAEGCKRKPRKDGRRAYWMRGPSGCN